MRPVILILAFVCVMAACTTPGPSLPIRAGHLSRAEVISHISVAPTGATFLSHNGRWQGTDTDARITLTKDNQAEVTQFRDAVDTYRGTYTVDDTGAVHVLLRRPPAKWPTMYLYTDRRGSVLLPAENSVMAAYWPFRQSK